MRLSVKKGDKLSELFAKFNKNGGILFIPKNLYFNTTKDLVENYYDNGVNIDTQVNKKPKCDIESQKHPLIELDLDVSDKRITVLMPNKYCTDNSIDLNKCLNNEYSELISFKGNLKNNYTTVKPNKENNSFVISIKSNKDNDESKNETKSDIESQKETITFIENDNGFDIMSKGIKISEINHAQILALACISVDRSTKLEITETDVRKEVWNISTRLG